MGKIFVLGSGAVLGAALLVACSSGPPSEQDQGGSDEPQIGKVSEALGTPPESNCTGVAFNGHDYWFCPSLRSWSTARTKCEAQGDNLVRIEDAAENAFVKGRIGLDSWIGGNDVTTEGSWVWTFGGSNFWIGTASGHVANGLYSNWQSLQPDNLGNQDCGKMALNGTWTDESCGLLLRYVCESGTDQCGTDPNKVVPGICGCGVSDVDTDGDGTADCLDQCPNDVTKIRPGDCGCSNAPRAAGTACSDGLCATNRTCNGAGVCGNPSSCPAPDTNCTFGVFQNNYYWFCNHDQTFANARQRCQSVGMDATAIESGLEDKFITSKISSLDHVFIGATDEVTSGTWVWKSTGQQFWSGGANGSSTAGAYANWEQGQPNDVNSTQRCAQKDPGINGGQWEARSCTLAEGYVCELDDACPFDPLKTAPGACGCNHPETNTDGDSAPDCIDECPTDPNKTKRGVCNCGNPDTDSDGDGVPNCVENFPNDPTLQQAGSCGKPGSLKPAGTPCNDGPCAVLAACDGAGHCGSSSACIPPNGGTCTVRQVLGKTYWRCGGPLTRPQAEASCASRPGQSLVEIDNGVENALVQAIISTDSWIGANDLGADGDWRWATSTQDAGKRFWTGGANGQSYFGSFAAWETGQPGGGAAEACGVMIASGTNRGTWDDVNCSVSRGFVCEVETGTGSPPIPDNNAGGCGNSALGLPCQSPEPCVPQTTAFPNLDLSTDAARAAAKAAADSQREQCRLACQSHTDETGCRAACGQTQLFVPPPDTGACAPWKDTQADFCELDLPIPSPIVKCRLDSDCPAQYRCGYAPQSLGTRGVDSERVCGTPNKFCPTIPDPRLASKCADHPLICADPAHSQTTQTWDPSSNLDPVPFSPDELGQQVPSVVPYAGGTQTPCGGSCVGKKRAHPWCRYMSPQSLRTLPDITDKDRNGTASGDTKLVSFAFDPRLRLHFTTSVGPLGLPIPDLSAEAGLGVTVSVNKNVVPVEPFAVIDVDAAMDGHKCSIGTTRSHAKLLGIDFVPTNGASQSEPNTTQCEQYYALFTESVDRTNKALRDAQALLKQYYAAINVAHNPLGNICQQLHLDTNLPVGFPAADPDCATEPAAKTIDRFIEYYKRTIYGFTLGINKPDLTSQASILAGFAFDPNSTQQFDLFNLASGSEQATLAEAQFFIGPIPVLLEVYGAVQYGVPVSANFMFSPGGFVQASLLNPNGITDPYQAAFFGLTGTPQAAAFLGFFAGVGFDFPGIEVKFGIDAQLELGSIQLPAHAGVGVQLTSDIDPRPQPDDLNDPVLFAAGKKNENMIPPKRYQAAINYAMGLDATATNILSGTINAELEFDFFFFSASWRQQLFQFTGFCGGGCGYSLIENQGTLDSPVPVPWDTVQMPTPFPLLVPPDFFANGQLPVGTGTVSLDQIDQLFYDTECACIATGDTSQQCQADADCCDSKLPPTDPSHASCFSDPLSNPPSQNVCSTCRKLPTFSTPGESCRTANDCCPETRSGGTVICGTDNRCDVTFIIP